MQCIIEFSQEGILADIVYKLGGHYYLLDFILTFDASTDITEQEDAPQNELSVRACMVLGTYSPFSLHSLIKSLSLNNKHNDGDDDDVIRKYYWYL